MRVVCIFGSWIGGEVVLLLGRLGSKVRHVHVGWRPWHFSHVGALRGFHVVGLFSTLSMPLTTGDGPWVFGPAFCAKSGEVWSFWATVINFHFHLSAFSRGRHVMVWGHWPWHAAFASTLWCVLRSNLFLNVSSFNAIVIASFKVLGLSFINRYISVCERSPLINMFSSSFSTYVLLTSCARNQLSTRLISLSANRTTDSPFCFFVLRLGSVLQRSYC